MDYTYDKPKHGFRSENHARRWAKRRKLRVKCVEYVKGGVRVQVANKKRCMTLRVNHYE
jgi:hypothetical protein